MLNFDILCRAAWAWWASRAAARRPPASCWSGSTIRPSGRILIQDSRWALVDIAHRKGKEMKTFRSRVQMIFQDPYESLNPRRTIFDTVAEPLAVQGIGTVGRARGDGRESAGDGRPDAGHQLYVPLPARAVGRASDSASPSPARWSSTRSLSSPTSRRRCWTSRSASA